MERSQEAFTPHDHPASAEPAMLTAVIDHARQARATHVHIDHRIDDSRWRMRVDGSLTPAEPLSPAAASAILAWSMAVAPHGHFGLADGSEVSVATLAIAGGHRIVIGIGDEEREDAALAALGLRGATNMAVVAALRQGGLVLVTGPEADATRTTLHALIAHVAGDDRVTLMLGAGRVVDLPPGDGVVRAIAGSADAATVRSAMRQDPDVLAIDGLASREAAVLAAQAAEGRRLVLATLAAPDTMGAIRQLRAWRIEPFQLASTLTLVMAQRRVRMLCPECRAPIQAEGSVSALLGFDPGTIVFSPSGCESCGGSGHAGESAVFETIQVDAALRRLINDGGDEAILARHAFLRAPTLGAAARRLARDGIIAPAEAVRISRG